MPPKRIHAPSIQHNNRIVGILVDTSSSWGRRVIEGAAHHSRQHSHWRLYFEARGMEEDLRVPSGWNGDGIIARVSSAKMARELAKLAIPVVNVSGVQVPDAHFPRITTDMPAGANMALDHFLNRGFRNFAYFSLRGLSYVTTHRDAFVAAAAAKGLPCSVFEVKPQFGAEPDWTIDHATILSWLNTLTLPVAIVAWNASCARAIVFAAQSGGLLVPEEVAILSGADDELLCEHIQPPVSGIAVDARKIGHEAAATLKQMLEGKKKRHRDILITPLGIEARQSTDTLAIKDSALVKALSYIRQNAANPIQVDDVAAVSGLSRRALERRFAETLNRSPAVEIRRCHIDRAKKLLQITNHSIPTVAESAGFCSPEHFSTYFKSATGKTPLQFRKENTFSDL